MKTRFLSLIFTCLLLFPFLSNAQTVKVSGEVTSPFTIDAASFNQFTHVSQTRKDRDGLNHTYTGVALSEILKKAGTTMDSALKGENLTKYLLVEASDGYQIIFSLAELDKSFTDQVIILADTIDGKPLATGDGPYRVIVPNDKKPARCAKQVVGLRVMFAK